MARNVARDSVPLRVSRVSLLNDSRADPMYISLILRLVDNKNAIRHIIFLQLPHVDIFAISSNSPCLQYPIPAAAMWNQRIFIAERRRAFWRRGGVFWPPSPPDFRGLFTPVRLFRKITIRLTCQSFCFLDRRIARVHKIRKAWAIRRADWDFWIPSEFPSCVIRRAIRRADRDLSARRKTSIFPNFRTPTHPGNRSVFAPPPQSNSSETAPT